MKKLIEGVKNIRNIVKFVSFLSDVLKAVVDVYERHYPPTEETVKED